MKRRLICILITLSFVMTHGQVNLSLSTEKIEYGGKDILNLTIVLDLNGSDLVQQTGFQLPDLSKFNIIGSGTTNDTFIDPSTHTLITQKISKITLEPKEKGKIKIGSILVTVNNRIYKTEPFEVNIRDISENRSLASAISNEIFLNMEIANKEIYQNQPVIAFLKVYSKNADNLRKVKNIYLPQRDNIHVYPINFTKSDIDPLGTENMASQTLAAFMIFPNEAGNIEIPGALASINSYSNKNKITSNAARLTVKSLPRGQPSSFKNAVGNFNIALYNISKNKPEAKKPLNVVVKIFGEGNLLDLKPPKIMTSPDYDIFTPKITSKVLIENTGVKGEITANYIVVPKKSGAISIKTEQFAFFNPEKKKYVELGYNTLVLDAFSHNQILETRSTAEKMNDYTSTLLKKVNPPVLMTSSLKIKKNKIYWNILIINISILLGLFIIFLLFKVWQKRDILFAETTATQSLRSAAETKKDFKEMPQSNIDDYLSYLENLKNAGKYDKFFTTLKELDQEIRNQYFHNSTEDFNVLLELRLGSAFAKDYEKLQHNIQIEKYSPAKSIAGLEELLKTITNLYSQIIK